VHRTTFYGHHRDVVGFAASVFVDELDAIARVEIDAHTSLAPLAISDACTESLTRMLEHIAHERRSAGAHERTTYRALFASPVGSGFHGGSLVAAPAAGHQDLAGQRPLWNYCSSASRIAPTSDSASGAHGAPSGFDEAASGLSPSFHHFDSNGTPSKSTRSPFS